MSSFVEELEAELAELLAANRTLSEDRDKKAEQLRLWKPVIDASAAIPVDNLVHIAERNGKRMARWAKAELARRNGKIYER